MLLSNLKEFKKLTVTHSLSYLVYNSPCAFNTSINKEEKYFNARPGKILFIEKCPLFDSGICEALANVKCNGKIGSFPN